MRIIAGSARGRNLKTPKGFLTRPTQDRVRESIFNVLMNYGFSDTTVLDLFAGTGALGIEALSRGAKSLVSIDYHTENLIRQNLELCGFSAVATVSALAVPKCAVLLRSSQFDYIFVDPPYEKNLVQLSIDMIAKENLLKEDGILVIEHHKNEAFTLPKEWSCFKEKEYDYTRISYISAKSSERS